MVPYVALPFATPFTVQVTAMFVVFITVAVMGKVSFTATVCAPVGLVIVTTTAFDPPLPPQSTVASRRIKPASINPARATLRFIAITFAKSELHTDLPIVV
jgi:hypothetical protein